MQVQKLDLLENAIPRATRGEPKTLARHAGPPAPREDPSRHATGSKIEILFLF
ncbi:hypothetical protein HanIR_Chr04g0194311 [Helianthus annuus]|nr:hypothetical protein HanIR_Chr04g0194311 [Helianthus annuus]